MTHWLCRAFGFEKQHAISAPDGSLIQAELRFGNGVVLVGAIQGSAYDALLVQPDEIGGLETQSCYLVVSDVDAHCATAKLAGADVIFDVQDDGDGGRVYTCRDPEGHIWNFGTFDPWRGEATPGSRPAGSAGGARRFSWLNAVLLLALVCTSLTAAWLYRKAELHENQLATLATLQTLPTRTTEKEQVSRDNSAERRLRDLDQQLADARRRQEAAESAAKAMQAQLASERALRESAEKATREVREQLVRDAEAMQAIARSARQFQGQVAVNTSPWTASVRNDMADNAGRTEEKAAALPAEVMQDEQALRDLRDELAREKRARLAAESALAEARRELARRRAATAQ
jgi:uncharacterized glyoxalase superfamily protein PhnB